MWDGRCIWRLFIIDPPLVSGKTPKEGQVNCLFLVIENMIICKDLYAVPTSPYSALSSSG
jgi:hypothetical protein